MRTHLAGDQWRPACTRQRRCRPGGGPFGKACAHAAEGARAARAPYPYPGHLRQQPGGGCGGRPAGQAAGDHRRQRGRRHTAGRAGRRGGRPAGLGLSDSVHVRNTSMDVAGHHLAGRTANVAYGCMHGQIESLTERYLSGGQVVMGLAESEDLGAGADAGGATPRPGHAVGAAGAA